MFIATVNEKFVVHAQHITGLKRFASRKANQQNNVVDVMQVHEDLPKLLKAGQIVHYTRINTKRPDGSIIRGDWH